MQFYEIELLTAPRLYFAVSVETSHYHNPIRHLHRFLEISVTCRGHAVYTFDDGHTEYVEPGMLCPVTSDMCCDIRACNHEFQAHDTVCVHVKYRAKKHDTEQGFGTADYRRIREKVQRGSVILLPYHEPLGTSFDVIHRQILRLIAMAATPGTVDKYRVIGEWYSLCASLTELVITRLEYQYMQISPAALHYVEQAKVYIAAHYKEALTVESIAAHLDISESYLYALFKSVTMISPMEFVNRYRMDRACTLAVATTLTLHEIAEQVGISDPSYMSRLFKKAVGVPFKEYRKSGGGTRLL